MGSPNGPDAGDSATVTDDGRAGGRPEPAGDRPSDVANREDWGHEPGDTRRRVKRVLVALGLAIAGFLAGFLLVPVAGTITFGILGVAELTVVQVVLSLVVLQGIAFPLVALAYLRSRDLTRSFLRVYTPTRRDLKWGAGGFVLVFVLVYALVTVITFLNAPTAQRADQQVLQQPDVLLTLIPLSFLLIGPGEELLFRGVIQGTLREVFSAPAAIVIASAMFAPAHLVALQGGVQALAVSVSILFVPSLVFGYAYERTRNLVVPALIHGAYNATIFALIYVALESGIEQPELLVP